MSDTDCDCDCDGGGGGCCDGGPAGAGDDGGCDCDCGDDCCDCGDDCCNCNCCDDCCDDTCRQNCAPGLLECLCFCLFDQPDNSSCCCSKKEPEEDQVMNQQPITTQIRNLSEHTESFRPLSEGSDSMYDTTPLGSGAESLNDVHSSTAILHRSRQNRLPQHQRPLTRYLPILSEDLNLRSHILSAGHQLDQCPHVIIDSTSCRGYLQKLGAKWHGWSKRWFLFDRTKGAFIYYADKSEKKPRGGAYFKAIDEVYLDHSVAAHNTFIVKTRQRHYKLLAPSSQAARIWIDSICTGAMGNMAYDL